MNLEKDLQQTKPFKSDFERAVVNLFFTSKFIERKHQGVYKNFGITLKQYNILRILRGAGKPISTQLIRERMIDRMSDISRIVDRMIQKELLSKCVNCNDKRLVDISLTEHGLKMLEEIGPMNKQSEPMLGLLTAEEAKELNRLLDKIRGYD